jgi:hypothetical protein
MEMQSVNLVMIPKEELASLKLAQQEILKQLQNLLSLKTSTVPIRHITAIEFMKAVRIKRTKFDQLVNQNEIKTIKKKRKIYVPISEVERYFSNR